MSTTERRPIRDRARTRRAVLDAAERMITRHGANVSLAAVAREAGVTKSGLMHHFPSREDLLAALVEQVVTRVWEEVNAHIDSGDERPGAFTRGYVRALTGDSAYLAELGSATGLLAQLGIDSMEHVLAVDPEDPARWNRAFEADGLPPGRVWAVRYAAEGLAIAIGTAYVTDEQLRLARAELLVLTETAPE
ncbi:TetR/AcrR family transcriptional regulator [Micromonospora sp. NPDC049033]|uniref:TetR/AcrR family transcriptional regulator n=1 Tax=Micromonospora sp. NPDC049033 TaxID=3155149 RepID=UPI0033DCC786